MKISAVIPAYNSEQTIGRAIESVLKQTRPADEIIVIDDGSTDATADTVRAFGDKVRLIQQENAGASVARNTGIQAAAGEWVAFLDADDEWLPEKLHLQTEHLHRHPDLRWTTANYYRCNCLQNHSQQPDMSDETIRRCRNHLNGCEFFEDYLIAYPLLAKGHTDTMLIRRALLLKAGLFCPSQKRMNDLDMWFRIAFHEPKIGFIFEPLAVYHLHVQGSIVKAHTSAIHVDQFLQRQLRYARQSGRLDTFRACAAITLGTWLSLLMAKGNGGDIRGLLKKYGNLLRPYTRVTTWLGSFCPALWKWNEERKASSK